MGGLFEWDDAKAEENLRKHGVDFRDARLVFRYPFYVERRETRREAGEARYTALGTVRGVVLAVAHTYRGGRIRIISAREAEPSERRRYGRRRFRGS